MKVCNSPSHPTPATKTLITYYQPALQKRLKVNQRLIKGKAWADYFDPELYAPVGMAQALADGPLASPHILAPDEAGLARLLETFAVSPVSGYGVIEDGPCSYTQSRHLLPGVTSQMMAWWFTWHPLESERYYLWFPHAHIHNSVQDPQRLADTKLSYGERLYHNPNHITEYIGDTYLDVLIHFNTPESFGLDPHLLQQKGFTFNASGISTSCEDPLTPMTLMLHLGRDTPAGFELVNRYWTGAHASWDRFIDFPDGGQRSVAAAHKAGMDTAMLEKLAFEMAIHDMTEFTALGQFLPPLYQAFGETS